MKSSPDDGCAREGEGHPVNETQEGIVGVNLTSHKQPWIHCLQISTGRLSFPNVIWNLGHITQILHLVRIR